MGVISGALFGRGGVRRIGRLDDVLEKEYATPEAQLDNKSDPLDEAIYIILSFQTDLPRVKETWMRLKNAYPTWESLERAPQTDVARVLRSAGLHKQKARTLNRLLREVRRQTGRLSLEQLRLMTVQQAECVLTRLPGLSWKGARCVLLYSLGRPVLPVDVNTFRIMKRTGILRADVIYRRRSVHDSIQRAVEPHRRRTLHVNLVIHGQRTCLPVAPECVRCPFRSECPMRGVASHTRRAARTRGHLINRLAAVSITTDSADKPLTGPEET